MRNFRKPQCCLPALTVFLCLVVLTLSAENRVNLLSNPGFEDLDVQRNVEMWQENPGHRLRFEEVEIVSAPRPVKSGDYALNLVQKGEDEKGREFGHYFSTARIPVKPFTEYTMSFMAKGEGMVRATVYTYKIFEGRARLTYPGYPKVKVEKDIPGEDRSYYIIEEGQPWQECSYTFTLTDEDTEVEKIAFVILAHGAVYIDDCFFGEKK